MKFGKWFSSQDATVKGTIIAAIATVAAAALTFAATVLVSFISAKTDNSNQALQQAGPGHSFVTPIAITSSSSRSYSSSPQHASTSAGPSPSVQASRTVGGAQDVPATAVVASVCWLQPWQRRMTRAGG
jgi:hypothetical protein